MKSNHIPEEQPRCPPEFEPDDTMHAGPSHRRGKWSERLELNEGPDATWQELMARIVRGGIIRGRLL